MKKMQNILRVELSSHDVRPIGSAMNDSRGTLAGDLKMSPANTTLRRATGASGGSRCPPAWRFCTSAVVWAYACPGSGITFSCGATTVPRSKSCGVGVIVRLYHGLSAFFVRSDQRTIWPV